MFQSSFWLSSTYDPLSYWAGTFWRYYHSFRHSSVPSAHPSSLPLRGHSRSGAPRPLWAPFVHIFIAFVHQPHSGCHPWFATLIVNLKIFEGQNGRGLALCTVDRSFGWLLDRLFHHISYTHVCHHIFSKIPIYHAVETSEHIRKVLEAYYLKDKTLIWKALLLSYTLCKYVDKDKSAPSYKYRAWYVLKQGRNNCWACIGYALHLELARWAFEYIIYILYACERRNLMKNVTIKRRTNQQTGFSLSHFAS